MEYTGLGMNDSPTIVMEAAAGMENARCLAVKFDGNGKGVLCGAGGHAMGLLLADTDGKVEAGAQLDVQVKDIGRWEAGAAVKPGDELASDAAGKAVKASAGDFIVAAAVTGAQEAGDIIQVQIIKAGYKAQASPAPAGKGDNE